MPVQPLPAGDDTGPLSPTVAHRLTAMAQLPFEQLEQAAAALRGQLRHQLTEQVNVPAGRPVQVMDFDTLTVEGPTVHTDPGGRTWFTYTGTATSRLSPRSTQPVPPSPDQGPADAGVIRSQWAAA